VGEVLSAAPWLPVGVGLRLGPSVLTTVAHEARRGDG